MKLKLFMVSAVVLLLVCQGVIGQTPTRSGGKLGVLMGDFKPKFIYSGGVEFPVPEFLKPLIENGDAAVFYSDAGWCDGADETYGCRVYAENDVNIWGGLHGSGGLGVWYFINTDGGDVARWAWIAEFGYTLGRLDIKIGGDIIDVKNGSDMYVAQLGLAIKL